MATVGQPVASDAKEQGVSVPRILYGTAWKEAETAPLVSGALAAGFRGIDTANQRRHYVETGVGEAVSGTLAAGSIRREDLFLQTKFTFAAGQDHRLPYDPNAPVGTQVEQSFASSLEHLGVSYLDSYVLHGPSARSGLSGGDWAAWRAIEALQEAGKTRLLGISNVTIEQLEELRTGSEVKPAVVQNRCFASTGWDADVRRFCCEHGMLYEGFSLLTANMGVLRHARTREIAVRAAKTTPQVIYRFALQVGMTVLTGTTSRQHMEEALRCCDFELPNAEVRAIESMCVAR